MADPDPSLTPEQKLLKLIEDPNAVHSPDPSGAKRVLNVIEEPAGEKAEPATKNLQAMLSPAVLKEQFLQFQQRWEAFTKGQGPPLNFKQVNKTAKIFTFVLIMYLVVAFVIEIVTIKHKEKGYNFKIEPKPAAEMPVPEGQTYGTDLFEDPNRRNVFVPYVKKAEEQPAPETVLSLKLLEITKDFKLTGISFYLGDPTRTFCMIEDIKKAMTSFLKVGDSISGLTVSEIKNDSVVLTHEHEKIELR